MPAARTPSPALRLTHLLEREYGARVTSVVPIAEYGEDEGGVYRIERQDGLPWVLRLFARHRPPERVRGDAAVLSYVNQCGVPAERLVVARDGAGATDLDGQGIVVTRFVAGGRPDRSPTTLRRLGEVLGRLHALATPTGDPWLERVAGSLPEEDLRAGRSDLARVAGNVLPARRAEFEALLGALDETNDCAALPSGLTHSDCHLDNAILTADGQTVLIDWVGSGQGPRVAALGVLLYSCAVRAPGDAPGSPWAGYWQRHGTPPCGVPAPDQKQGSTQMRSVVEAVVAGYCQHHLLTPAELEFLPHAIRFRPLVIAAREFAASLERDQPPDPAGWWTRYSAADMVAAYAREALAGSAHYSPSGTQNTEHPER